MIKELRDAFNARYDEGVFKAAMARVERDAGGAIPFRIAESPIFLPPALLAEMQRTSLDIIRQVGAIAGYEEKASPRIPPGALLPRAAGTHPLFVVFDYAIAVGPDGVPVPRLTEMQGFPSLIAFQGVLNRTFREAYDLPRGLRYLCDGLDEDGVAGLMRDAVLGGHDPETVALVDIRPWEQGTWPDFRFTQALCPGLAVVDAKDLVQRGARLFRRDGAREVPVARIFNRMVWEDLQSHRQEIAFDPRTALVEWASHPNDFFYWSKVTLPFLGHENVPRALFLDAVEEIPADLERWVLKPLFSFGSRGLQLDLDRAAIDAIPPAERGGLLLQQKFDYADAIRAADGGVVRCEVRLMYLWRETPVCVTTLPRMSRGRVMGCAFNRTEPWTGHGVTFFP